MYKHLANAHVQANVVQMEVNWIGHISLVTFSLEHLCSGGNAASSKMQHASTSCKVKALGYLLVRLTGNVLLIGIKGCFETTLSTLKSQSKFLGERTISAWKLGLHALATHP
jgi:predicted NBD/HSP70 family sugar kinase